MPLFDENLEPGQIDLVWWEWDDVDGVRITSPYLDTAANTDDQATAGIASGDDYADIDGFTNPVVSRSYVCEYCPTSD